MIPADPVLAFITLVGLAITACSVVALALLARDRRRARIAAVRAEESELTLRYLKTRPEYIARLEREVGVGERGCDV